MKTFISLLITSTIVFTIGSCSKKDDPQPSTLPGNNGGGTTTPTFSKTVQFYQATDESNVTYFYVSKDPNNLTYYGTLDGFTLTKNSASIESSQSNPGSKIVLTSTGRYYYQMKRGSSVSSTAAFEGYFDVSANGDIALTQTLPVNTLLTSGPRVIYENCYTSSFTVYYK